MTVNVSQNRKIIDADCAFCGQCVTHCPTAALRERDDTEPVLDILADPTLTTVVQVAPAVRVAWAEEMGLEPGPAATRKLVAALRRLGFHYVFDTNFAADLTIMEEGSEFVERFTHRDQYQWPMFTSCCPGWVRFVKSNYPEFTPNLSTAKSPQQMFGAVAKSYFAEKAGLDPRKLRVVSIMPCLAKKAEAALEPMRDACGDPDVDVVLTTRELIRMVRADKILVENLPEEDFDSPLGTGTGAAVVFGARGRRRPGGSGQQPGPRTKADGCHPAGRRGVRLRGGHGLPRRLRRGRRTAHRGRRGAGGVPRGRAVDHG